MSNEVKRFTLFALLWLSYFVVAATAFRFLTAPYAIIILMTATQTLISLSELLDKWRERDKKHG